MRVSSQARALLLKHNIVASLSELLQGNDVQQEVGLALLQNVSLYSHSHAELLQGGFIARLARFVSSSWSAHVFMRGKACAVLQHVKSTSPTPSGLPPDQSAAPCELP